MHINLRNICSGIKENWKVLFLSVLLSSLLGCTVMKGDESLSQYNHDTKITSSIKYALAKNKNIPASDIHVETKKGVVLLSGFIKSAKQSEAAVKVAKSVSGVKSVKNNLVTNKEAHSNEPYYKAKRAITYN